MRKLVLVLAVSGLLIAAFAPVALAVNFQCSLRPCEGTGDNDTLWERGGDGISDLIYGLRGNDRVNANISTDDRDILYGNQGRDRLNASDGDRRDTVSGGTGFDVCVVDGRREVGGGCNDVLVR